MRRYSKPIILRLNPPAPQTPPDPLPLSAQYTAAWSEHSTRVAQRQSVMQMYLAAAGVIYGWYVVPKRSDGDPRIAQIFTTAITAITLGSSALMFLHNLVIKKLTEFMTRCEYRAAKTLRAQGRRTNLLYFCDKVGYKTAPFHERQRWLHRGVLVALLGVTNGYAIYDTRVKIGPPGVWVASAFCLLSMVLMVFDVILAKRRAIKVCIRQRIRRLYGLIRSKLLEWKRWRGLD